jgi:hypothetical protein
MVIKLNESFKENLQELRLLKRLWNITWCLDDILLTKRVDHCKVSEARPSKGRNQAADLKRVVALDVSKRAKNLSEDHLFKRKLWPWEYKSHLLEVGGGQLAHILLNLLPIQKHEVFIPTEWALAHQPMTNLCEVH